MLMAFLIVPWLSALFCEQQVVQDDVVYYSVFLIVLKALFHMLLLKMLISRIYPVWKNY